MAAKSEEVKLWVQKNLRQILAILGIWLVGWLNFSLLWVLLSFVSYVCWNHFEEEKKRKLNLLRAIAQDEKNFLLSLQNLPSWVCFPEVERAEWLNQIIAQMWPFLSTMISDILKNKIELEIQKKHSVLKTFQFQKVDLGSRPLKLGGINVYSKHVRPNEIIVDAEIMYAGDAHVNVSLKGIDAGISDLQLRGTLRIELSPLVSKSPIIGGIKLYFLDTPDFDFDLTNFLNVLDIPGLSQIVKKVLADVIESYVVLPNRITIPLASELDLDAIKYPLPLGALNVKILEAVDLVGLDKNLFKQNTSDPYVISQVGSFQHRTKTIANTVNPKWKDESFTIFINTLVGLKLQFQLYDEDKLAKDEKLGSVYLKMSKLSHSSSEDMWLPLEGIKKGKLHVVSGWNDFSDDVSFLKELKKSDQSQPVACLFIKLDHAKALPATDMSSDTSSPFIKITVGNETVYTKTQRNTKNPVWEELHSFFITNPHFQIASFQVLDKTADGPLGVFDFPISNLLTLPGMKIKQAFPLRECFTNGEIYMAIELKALVPPKLTHSDE